MMHMNDNNLNDLLRRFVDETGADTMAEDIRRGDALLEQFPSPAMSAEAVDRLHRRLDRLRPVPRRRTSLWGWAGAAAAAAAAMVLLSFGPADIPHSSVEPTPTANVQPSAPVQPAPESQMPDHSELPGFTLNLWDDTYHKAGDEAFAAITAELDNIAAWIEAVGWMEHPFSDERPFNGDTARQREKKVELTDFWKG